MTPPGITLESVQRRSGGRIHLTPRVPTKGPVTTLCGQTLAAGTYSEASSAADCVNCVRRSRDQSRVSGAFFAQDEGGELLRLSLEQARWQRPARASQTQAAARPAVVPSLPKPRVVALPDRLGELITRDFKPAGEGVWRSPLGVVVRMERKGRSWRLAELVYEGEMVVSRGRTGIRVWAGDVEIAPTGDGFEVGVRMR